MNNSVFGKTMENVKERIKLHLTTDDENLKKWAFKDTFKGGKTINGLHIQEFHRTKIVYDKPIYIGASTLDLSRLHMTRFHYEVIEKHFPGKYELLYTDTDSLVYLITCDDIFAWQKEHSQYFDLSDSVRPDMKDNTNKKSDRLLQM